MSIGIGAGGGGGCGRGQTISQCNSSAADELAHQIQLLIAKRLYALLLLFLSWFLGRLSVPDWHVHLICTSKSTQEKSDANTKMQPSAAATTTTTTTAAAAERRQLSGGQESRGAQPRSFPASGAFPNPFFLGPAHLRCGYHFFKNHIFPDSFFFQFFPFCPPPVCPRSFIQF